MATGEVLTDAEARLWAAWTCAGEAITAAVASDIVAASDLSLADFSVLTRVVEVGGGSLRQRELAELLGWERSRLSRHLSRMATPVGRVAVAVAIPAHAAAVRRALLDGVGSARASAFWTVIAQLSGEHDA